MAAKTGWAALLMVCLAFGAIAPEAQEADAPPPEAEAADKARTETEARMTEAERAARAAELYRPGSYRIAEPGARPVSNFYHMPGFRLVDPQCYSGLLTWEAESLIPLGGGAKFYVYEQIRIRPIRTARRYNQLHRWEVWADPLEMMGTVTTSEGSGRGRARVSLGVDMARGLFRLVTDVRPRSGPYEISSSGAGLSRSATEEFFLYFADHHYSYVDLSQLQAVRGVPAVESALADIRALLRNRPPNVHMGYVDFWVREVDGPPGGVIRLQEEERFAFSLWVKTEGVRRVDIRIFCEDLVRRFRGP